MANPNLPILFGVDPDEVWRYVPEAARKAGLKSPVFLLKAPSLATTVKREDLVAERRRATEKAAPGVIDSLREITGGAWNGIPKVDASATQEEKDEYEAKVRRFTELNIQWLTAFESISQDFQDRDDEIESRILTEAVVGWEGLTTASQKPILFDSVKNRLADVLRGALREEIIGAALAGTFVSDEDSVGLQSSPASQQA